MQDKVTFPRDARIQTTAALFLLFNICPDREGFAVTLSIFVAVVTVVRGNPRLNLSFSLTNQIRARLASSGSLAKNLLNPVKKIL